jgi:hypothetical protein
MAAGDCIAYVVLAFISVSPRPDVDGVTDLGYARRGVVLGCPNHPVGVSFIPIVKVIVGIDTRNLDRSIIVVPQAPAVSGVHATEGVWVSCTQLGVIVEPHSPELCITTDGIVIKHYEGHASVVFFDTGAKEGILSIGIETFLVVMVNLDSAHEAIRVVIVMAIAAFIEVAFFASIAEVQLVAWVVPKDVAPLHVVAGHVSETVVGGEGEALPVLFVVVAAALCHGRWLYLIYIND